MKYQPNYIRHIVDCVQQVFQQFDQTDNLEVLEMYVPNIIQYALWVDYLQHNIKAIRIHHKWFIYDPPPY